MTALETLKRYFGYDGFRSGQEALIEGTLAGRDVFGVMPTGAGKSVCFQIPALMMDGVAIVVSPLISLMKDQVNSLTQSGIAAAFINSSLNARQIDKVLQNAANGMYKLIYVAPERLLVSDFLHFAQSAKISMLCVDEAHCISQWGQDFRPSYSRIPEFITRLPKRPVLSAYTATATTKVREDIEELLELKSPIILVTGFDRQNLRFEVQKPKNKYDTLTEFLNDKKERSGIVYCSARATVEEVCEKLKADGYSASRYHAGLSEKERHDNQDDFLYDRIQIMVATNAFGMGIDKSNVSFVVHYNMPKDIESYYQEAGRAGRDGEYADCLLLYSGQDVRTNLWMIENNRDVRYPNKETEKLLKDIERKRLHEMSNYCNTNYCLRGHILKYFGEKPPKKCTNCSNCDANFETEDITIDAKKILSCVARMNERYGIKMIVDVLRGSNSNKVLSLGFDKLSTHGISEKSNKQLHEIIGQLISMGYLVQTNDEYPVIKLGANANEVLHGDKILEMKLSRKTAWELTASNKQTQTRPVNKKLFAVLRELRFAIASEQNVPAFVIFPDSALVDMCMKIPTTNEGFLNVSGVGQMKLEKYGEKFLKAIADFLHDNDIETPASHTSDTPKTFDASLIEVSDEPVTISVIADRINCVLLECGYKKLNGMRINNWLVSENYMMVVFENGKNHKVPTEKGEDLGITSKECIIRGESVNMNMYGRDAQEFIVANTLKAAGFRR